MSARVAATAAASLGSSGGTRLNAVLSERTTSSAPSFVLRTILPASMLTTSPVTTDGFVTVSGVCATDDTSNANSVNKSVVRVRFINRISLYYIDTYVEPWRLKCFLQFKTLIVS